MGGYTKDQMWNGIMRLAEISHSTASDIQRTVKHPRDNLKTAAMSDLEMPDEIEVKQVIEEDVGKLLDSDC